METACPNSIMRDQRNVKFFEITGQTLVHPISYRMQEFQKKIITTAVTKNTLISLPSGLGMPYLSSVLVFNFQRWFLNGKIVILSQTKNYIGEQINAYSSFTTLSEEYYSDLYGNTGTNENEAAWNKPIVLTTPLKFLDSVQNNVYKISNLVLLIVYETNKIAKCLEYQNLMNLLRGIDFRVVVFVDGCGFNAKIVKQIINVFNISQLEIRKLSSPDIKECTFCSEIESVALDITPHMISIKDAFYAVYEKYGKLLKDARVINGNIASFTKNQIQKVREKLIKAPPANMNKNVQQNLLDSMTMCAFLCTGIDILHNWGVRSFYNYLFDENKDGKLKVLIVQDEHLKNQMKLLNEYLKSNGKKVESLVSRIIHPKLLYMKNLITRHFSEADEKIEDIRIVVYCSMEEIIDDVNRILANLPDYIRHQCVKTKAKSLSNTNEYKDVIKNFNNGVINVLVLSNLVEEINEIKTNLIISLEPNKTLLKFSDPRFCEGADKCFFVLTKGSEHNKFESLLNEKRNEQKSVDIPEVGEILKESPYIFPENFNPEFESASVASVMLNANQSSGQKSMLNYLTTDENKKSKKSLTLFDDSDVTNKSIFAPSSPQNSSLLKVGSPAQFNSKFENNVLNSPNEIFNNLDQNDASSLCISPQPIPYYEQMNDSGVRDSDNDSFDELLLNFAVDQTSKVKGSKQSSSHGSSKKENNFLICRDEDDYKCRNDMNHNSFSIQHDDKSSKISRLELLHDAATNLSRNIRDDCTSPSILNLISSPEIKPRSPSVLENSVTNIFNEINSTLRSEMFKDFSLLDSSKRTPGVDRMNKSNQSTNISPILSFKKSSKKLSRSLFSVKDRSPSIHFDSTFEVDDDFSVNLQRKNESKSKLQVENERTDDDFCISLENVDKSKNNLSNKDNVQRKDSPQNIFSVTKDKSVDDDFCSDLQNNRKPRNNFFFAKAKPTNDDEFFINLKNSDVPKNNLVNSLNKDIMENLPEPAPNIDDWDPDCELFEDDDTFAEIAANVVTPFKETASVKTSTPAIKLQSLPEPLPKAEKIKTDECDNISFNSKRKAMNDFFSNFSSSIKRRSQNTARNLSPVKESKKNKDDEDSADEFPWMTKSKPLQIPKLKVNDEKPAKEYPWMKESPVRESLVQHVTPDFKKPGPFVVRSSKSRSVTPSTPHTAGSDRRSISSESTPDLIVDRNSKKRKKNINLKRKLAEQFLDNEAEVTDDDNDANAEEYSHISDEEDSFIDDDTVVAKNSTYSHYLKSLKSPGNKVGKFHIPVLSETKLKMNVCSQMDYFDQTYQNDSFCVDDVPVEPDSEYVPSILTQMEDRLQFEKKKKTKRISRLSDDSSGETSSSPNHRKKKHRKRIVCFLSSDSE